VYKYIYLFIYIYAYSYVPHCLCVIRELWACGPHFMRKYRPTGMFTTVFIAENNSSSCQTLHVLVHFRSR